MLKVERGSVFQTVTSAFASFLFFGIHIKMCEIEIPFSFPSLVLVLSHDVFFQ